MADSYFGFGTIPIFFINALSPIYTMGLAAFAIWGMFHYHWTFSWWKISVEGVNLLEGSIVTITILAGLCVIAEGILIRRTAIKVTTPCVEKKRSVGCRLLYIVQEMFGYYQFSL